MKEHFSPGDVRRCRKASLRDEADTANKSFKELLCEYKGPPPTEANEGKLTTLDKNKSNRKEIGVKLEKEFSL